MIGLNGKGIKLRFERSVTGAYNPFGEPIKAPQSFDIPNVIVAPGKTSELSDGNRPEGVIVAYTLHIPKEHVQDLTGCTVSIPCKFGGFDKCKVIGSPRPLMEDLTPGDWNMAVEVELVNG